jgi:hypothetical protein
MAIAIAGMGLCPLVCGVLLRKFSYINSVETYHISTATKYIRLEDKMDLKNYVEVECEFNEIVLGSSGGKVTRLKSLFEEKVRKTKLMPSNQIFDMDIDGRKYLICQLYVEMFDQVVIAYNIDSINGDIVIHARRFEKANVAGGALFKLLQNVFSGKSRTIKMEGELIKHTGKFVKGMTSPSPLGKDSLFVAGLHIRKINECLEEAINQI